MTCKELSVEQKDILLLLKQLWELYPKQRLGQLLENYVFYQGERGDKTSCRLFFQQDEETLHILLAKKGEARWNEYGEPIV